MCISLCPFIREERKQEKGQETQQSCYLITHPGPGMGHRLESALPLQQKEGEVPILHINGKMSSPLFYLPTHAAVNNSHFINTSAWPHGVLLLSMKRYWEGLEERELGQDQLKQLLQAGLEEDEISEQGSFGLSSVCSCIG